MDEPSFKSTFSVTLVRPTLRYKALSNMPVESEVNNSPSQGLTEVKVRYLCSKLCFSNSQSLKDWYTINSLNPIAIQPLFFFQFQKSVQMVTYLTCFIVCDFDFDEKKTAGMEIPIRYLNS